MAASAAAGLAGGFGFFRPLGVGQGGLGVALVGEAADPEGASGLWAQADADQEIAVLRALGQGHVPPARLGKPAAAGHLRPTGGAEVVRPGHVVQGLFLSGQTVIYLPGEAAGELRPVEAVFMALEGRLVLLDAPFQIQACADKSSVIGIPQGVMGRAAGGIWKNARAVFRAFWELEPSVWALNIIWALYQRRVQSAGS